MRGPNGDGVTRPAGKPPATSAPAPSIRGHWDGAFTGKRTATADLSLVAPLQKSKAGGSGSFLASASDGRRYWIKPLNNLQCERVCITEQVVGRVGQLLGAPTCAVKTIEIPSALAGWQFHADENAKLEAGIAHASLETLNAMETRLLERRRDDSNAARHAYVLALYDLCWGDDAQWLMDVGDEYRFYSHDHGLYFPQGPWWTVQDLARCIDAPRPYTCDDLDIDRVTVALIVARLRALTNGELVQALAGIPTTWPVTDAELELVGHFILSRAANVATRLEARFRARAT